MSTQQLRSLPTSVRLSYFHQIGLLTNKMVDHFNWSTILIGAGLFTAFVVVLAMAQFSTPHLAGNDGYYHIKLAQIMRQQGLVPPFPWLPLTVLSPTTYVDHHFLYHVLLIPFTFGDLREGAKWASVIFPAFTFFTGWILLRGQRVQYSALWSLGFLAVSEAFLYRMSMPRAQSVSLLILLLGLHVVLTRRYRWLVPISFLYVWLYDAFPLILILVGVYVASQWLIDREFDLVPLFYAALGIGLGLLINPYFPDNLLFIYHHLLPKLTDATSTSVGKEWYPYQTWTLVENSGPALLLFVAGVVALGLQERRMTTPTATLLFLTVLFGVMLFKSRRFVEYFPAISLLFCALALNPFFKQWTHKRKWVARELPVLMVVLLIPAILYTVQTTQTSLQKSKPYQLYAGASGWLQANTPAGSRVFQTDWDDFTRLYFYNTHNTYTTGLDPTYMQLYDVELYDLWVDISKGQVDNPGQIIANTFNSSYVVTDLTHKGFLRKAETDPRLQELYRDADAVVFQVVDQPGTESGKGD